MPASPGSTGSANKGRSARQNASPTAVLHCHGAQTRRGLRGGGRLRVLSTDAVAPPSLFAAPPLPADDGVAHRLLRTAHARRAHGNATVWRFPRRASLGEVSPPVEESVLRTSLADPAPSDAFPGCAARRVARMAHFSKPVSPSRLTHAARESAQRYPLSAGDSSA